MLNDLIVIEKRVKGKNCISEDTWAKDASCWACREKTVTTEVYSSNAHHMTVKYII